MRTENNPKPTELFSGTMRIFIILAFIALMGTLVISYNKPERVGQTTTMTNGQLEKLYSSSDKVVWGFSSTNYSLTDYEGNTEITLPTGKDLNFVSNVSEQNNIFFRPGGMLEGRGIEVSSLGKTVRVCYKNKPFFQASSTPLPCDKFSPIKFSLSEYTIDGNSFVFIHGDHDFQGEVGGLYINGSLVSQKVMVKGIVPFLPIEVKKIGKDVIVCFVNANGAKMYALYQTETNQLILPVDYESI